MGPVFSSSFSLSWQKEVLGREAPMVKDESGETMSSFSWLFYFNRKKAWKIWEKRFLLVRTKSCYGTYAHILRDGDPPSRFKRVFFIGARRKWAAGRRVTRWYQG